MTVYQHGGITILGKREAAPRAERKSRIALVLACGAITGGAFKAGGLRALDEMLRPNIRLHDFDMFVGMSAGALLAIALAAGIDADELFRITIDKSDRYHPMRAYDVLRPNLREPRERVALFLAKTAEVLAAYRAGRTDPRTHKRFTAKQTALKLLGVVGRLAPTGLLDPAGVREYLCRQIELMGVADDFRELERVRGKSLLVTAVDINTGTQVVFGPRERYAAVPVSAAVSASCALPGLYRTARVPNPRYREPNERRWLDLADGGVVRTANVDVAIERGADLIIVYNPYTPLRYTEPDRSLYDHGAYALANQLFRTVLGSRLDLGKDKIVADPNVKADVIYIEPRGEDLDFFVMNPMNLWSKHRAAQHGYDSVRAALAENHEQLRTVFARHGVELSGSRLVTRSFVA